MPGTSTHRHPKGFDIVFDEATHTYTTTFVAPAIPGRPTPQHVVKYTSGTTFIHKFTPPFDKDGKIAERKARERGVSPDQIRFEWKQKGVEATEMGTRVHETCEDILHGRQQFRNQPQSPHERNLMSSGWRACQFILKNYEIVGIEQMVGDVELAIAGTMDLIAKRKSDGRWTIFDWKTNAKIDFENRWGGRMLHEIAHLHDCSAVHYGLQLNLYEYIMKHSGYLPRETPFDRAIIHLADDGPHPYPLPDYQIEVRDMVIHDLLEVPF